MATLAAAAEAYIDELTRDYLKKNRPEAIERLADAVEKALVEVDRGASIHRRYPATYRDLAALNMMWVKIHRYWFGYVQTEGGKVIFNVFYDAADIRRRIRPRG